MSYQSPVTVFTSAARTTTTNSTEQYFPNARGVILTLDVTAASGTTPTLDVKVQYADWYSGKFTDIAGAAFAQKTGVSTAMLTIYPGIAETANVSVSDVLPQDWRVVATIGGTTPSFTFSVTGVLVY